MNIEQQSNVVNIVSLLTLSLRYGKRVDFIRKITSRGGFEKFRIIKQRGMFYDTPEFAKLMTDTLKLFDTARKDGWVIHSIQIKD